MSKQTRRRLGREDWAHAALRALARGGIDAIAVEPIAAELGATKGSFYWHFENRDALVEAALQAWEQIGTDAVIAYLEKESDPARRLRILIEAGYERAKTDRVEIALLANPGHPAAVRTMRRVAQRRLRYMAEQLEALGWEPQEARDRAVLIGHLYIGGMQMAHVARRLNDASARRRQAELIFNALVEGGVVPPSLAPSAQAVEP